MQLSKFAKKLVTVNSVAMLLSATTIPALHPRMIEPSAVHAASKDDSGVSEWSDWGTVKWGVDDSGTLWIKPQEGSAGSIGDVYGEISGDTIKNSNIPWLSKATDIKSVRLESKITGSNMAYLFAGLTNCSDIDLTNLKVDSAKSLQAMFAEDVSLEKITGLDKFNTSNVTDMYGVFQNCPKLTDDTISGVAKWDTSKVTKMQFLFYNCKALTAIPVSGWNTSSVTSFFGTFDNCYGLTALDVSKWNTANATDISWMFNGCKALKTIDVSKWNTSKMTTMSTVFNGCSNLANLDVSKWDTTNVTTTSMMFNGCCNLANLDVSKWNTSNVTAMNNMFNGCCNLVNLDVSKWNTANVTNMYALFSGCSSLANLDMSKWNTSKVATMYALFSNCSSLAKLDLSSWSTKSITNVGSNNTKYIFSGDGKLSELKLGEDFILKGGEDSLSDPAKTGEYTGRWSKTDGSNGMSAKEMLSLTGEEHDASGKSLNKTLDAVDRAGTWVWERGYTVAVDPNGGTGTAKSYIGALSENQTYGTDSVGVYIEDPGYTRKAYENTGANEKKDGIGTKYQYPFTLQTSSNKTIYAQWKFNGLKIAYHANGGKGVMSDTIIAKGDTASLTSNSFTRTGYDFDGWNTSAQGNGASYGNAQSVTPDSDLDLYAQWKGIPYTIKFDANTGSGSMDDEQLVYGTSKAISKNTFTKKSYVFSGWNTKEDGKGTEYADQQEVSDLSASGQTVTLYAQWRKADWNSSGTDITKTKDEGDTDATHDAGTYILTIPTRISKKGMPVGNVDESVSYDVNVTGNIPEDNYVHVSADASSGLAGSSGALNLDVTQGKRIWNEEDAYGTVNPDGSLSGSTASDTVKITGTSKSIDQYSGLVTYTAVMNNSGQDPISSKTSWGSFSISSQDKKALETYEDSGQLGFTAGTTLHSDLTGTSYQWSINGVNISGADQADYLVTDADLKAGEENGRFQSNKLECTVTKADGTKETAYVYLAVPLTYSSAINVDLRRTLTDNGNIAYEGYTTSDGKDAPKSINCGWKVPATAVSFKATDKFVPSEMFIFAYGAGSLETFDASNIDTSQVTNMQDLFYRCGKIKQLDVSGWDVSKVKNFILAFGSMASLTTLNGIESWDTQSATNMQSMFYLDSKLSIDLSGWNVSKVTVSNGFNYGAKKVIAPKWP